MLALSFNGAKMEPRSQKAKGIKQLIELPSMFIPFGASALQFVLMQEAIDVGNLAATGSALRALRELGTSNLFVRPCPATPRHGFADSRPWRFDTVEKLAELNAMLAEAQADDPQAELVIMERVDATHNLVHTGNTLTVGAGNDGATSGKNAVSLPCVPAPLDKGVAEASGITQSAFMEFVTHAPRHFYITQLRDGPAVPTKPRYVPAFTVVNEIVVIPREGDRPSLLDWEKQCESYVGRHGLVVWHPGGAMSSHYAVHCLLKKIAIVCDEEPQIGDTLKSTVDAKAVLAPSQVQLKAAFKEAISWPGAVYQSSGLHQLSLYALHNISAFDWSNPLHTRLLGWCLATTLRQATAALWGERRYGEVSSTTAETIFRTGGGSRSSRYKDVLDCARFEDMLHYVCKESTAFGYAGWGSEPFNAGTGGFKWLECADLTYKLWNALVAYLNDVGEFETIIMALNAVINVAHNGAKLLTKFIDFFLFDQAATEPHKTAIQVAPELYHMLQTPQVRHKRMALKFKSAVIPSSGLVSPELRKQYELLVTCGGNKRLATCRYYMPSARAGDDWISNTYNFLHAALEKELEIKCKQLEDPNSVAVVTLPQIQGPWVIHNPWCNLNSPTNFLHELCVPDYGTGTTSNLNIYETPVYLDAMHNAKPDEGWYEYCYYTTSNNRVYWQNNSFYNVEKRNLALKAIESFIRWPIQTGKAPQLAA